VRCSVAGVDAHRVIFIDFNRPFCLNDFLSGQLSSRVPGDQPPLSCLLAMAHQVCANPVAVPRTLRSPLMLELSLSWQWCFRHVIALWQRLSVFALACRQHLTATLTTLPATATPTPPPALSTPPAPSPANTLTISTTAAPTPTSSTTRTAAAASPPHHLLPAPCL